MVEVGSAGEGERLLAEGKVEYTARASGETSVLTRDELLAKLK